MLHRVVRENRLKRLKTAFKRVLILLVALEARLVEYLGLISVVGEGGRCGQVGRSVGKGLKTSFCFQCFLHTLRSIVLAVHQLEFGGITRIKKRNA